MKKTLVALCVVTIICIAVWVFIGIKSGSLIAIFQKDMLLQNEQLPDSPAQIMHLLENAQILAPESEQRVQLRNGQGNFQVEPDLEVQGIVSFMSNGYVVSKHQNRTDIIAILTVNNGGSGTFYYCVLFDYSAGAFTKKSEIFLGDRIAANAIRMGETLADTAGGYRLYIQTLDREETESLSSLPTIAKQRIFQVIDQQLQEITAETIAPSAM